MSEHQGSAQVGVVGLGAMGRPIAEHLLAAGMDVTVSDLDADVVAELVEQGATGAHDLAAVGSCDVVIVVVPSDDDVRTVCLGEAGLLAAARPGSVLVISSSVTDGTCADVARVAADRDVSVLDAALTGGVRGAQAGAINLLVGGDADVLARVRPVLEPWTRAVHHLGPLGSGQIGKTVNNLIHWVQISGIHEALLLGRRLGVAPSRLREALLDGSVRSGTLAEIDLMHFTWWRKDIHNARLMAAAVDYDLPLTDTVYELMPTITVDRIARLVNDEEPVA